MKTLRGVDPRDRIRAMSRIDDCGCWLWTGNKRKHVKRNGRLMLGYGVIKYMNKSCLAHRVSYQAFNGDIPKEMLVCHKCDRPDCVNPEHLFVGTQKDNMQDCSRKGRAPCGIKHPKSKLTDDAIKTIRSEYVPFSREHGGAALARRFNVDESLVSEIINRKRWRNVE